MMIGRIFFILTKTYRWFSFLCFSNYIYIHSKNRNISYIRYKGLQCFEGMKAYRSLKDKDSIHLFRPDKNVEVSTQQVNRMYINLSFIDKIFPRLTQQSIIVPPPHRSRQKRLKNSMRRLAMPGVDFDKDELIKLISELVKVDKDWIPEGEGYSLYIRPTVIATHRFLGVSPPDSLLLYVITSPVGPYYKTGFDPIRLTTDTDCVRAWPGGTGKWGQ